VFLFVDSRWHEPHDAVQCHAHGSTFEFLFEFQTEFFSNFLFEFRVVRASDLSTIEGPMFPSSVESSARRHHCVHLPLFQSFLNTVCRSEVLLVGCLIIEVNFFVTVKENVQNKCHRICSLNDTLHLYGSILHLFNYLLAFPWKFSDMFSEQQVHNAHRGFRRKKRDVKFSEGEREAVFSV